MNNVLITLRVDYIVHYQQPHNASLNIPQISQKLQEFHDISLMLFNAKRSHCSKLNISDKINLQGTIEKRHRNKVLQAE